MDSRVIVMASDVIKMIKVQLDPSTDQNQRLQAYQVHEEFKRKSPLCPDVGFYIFDKEQNLEIPVRLCGLQLVEWFVQNNWDSVEPTWRDEMKVKAMKLIELADFKEKDCLKGAVVKVVVEVIKRSWPQQWGSLFEDLSNLQMKGNAQLELVLIILMRLSEDLNGLDDKVKQQRRRDMVTTLNNHLGELLQFFISTLHEKAVKLKESNNVHDNLRLTITALNTIAEYASWVNFEFLITKEKVLFQVLFLLLEIDEIKYNAAHCLCTIFERKGQPEKRVEMMVILSEDALSVIENAAHNAASKAELGNHEEYKFLKKLAEMLLHFGRSQIAALWGEDKGFKERPKCFDKYLKIMLDFTKHESLAINGLAAKLWHCFSFHKEIPKDEMYLAAIELLPKELLRMMSKLSQPTLTNNPGTKYTMMELDDPEDFRNLYNESRRSSMDILKQITMFIPEVILQFVMEKAEEYLSIELPDVKGYPWEQIVLSNHSLLWHAYQQFCRHFFMVFFESKEVVTPDVVQKCNAYLKTLVEYDCDNPVLLTPIILTMETLFPVFRYSQEMLKSSLQKLSNLMQLSSDGVEQQKKIKRHAIIILTNLCKKSPELLADKFDDLYAFFGAKTRENIFTNHEKKLLIEGLLNVSKTLTDTVKMKGFIDEVFEVPLSFFKRDDMKEIFTNTSSFIKYLGLDVEANDEAAFARRNELILSLYTLEAAARALVITKEDEINDYPEDNEITQTISNCPWMKHMIDSLPYLFDIARQVCLLWTKVDDQSAIFKDVLLQDQCEINAHVKKIEVSVEEEDGDVHKVKPNKQFPVFAIHEAIYTSLSLYGRCLGPVLFSLPGMMDAFLEKVVKCWVHYPNYRMRKVWRAIIKGFSLQCPAKYYESVLGPFLATVLEQMFERLSKEWPRVQGLAHGKHEDDDDVDDDEGSDKSSEILELRIIYNLSKEVLEILVSLCLFKRSKKVVIKAPEDNADMIGALGEFLLTYPQTNLQLITIFFTALTWPDASIIDRLCTAITAIVKKMFVPENPVNPEIPNQMLLRLLQGLQLHGSDQTAQSAIVNATLAVYLQMRQQYPSIVHVMMMVPTCTEDDLKNFDILMFIEVTNINESTKRKRFRKFLQGAIGKTVSELHKNDIKIQDLPPLAPRVKPPKPDLIVDAEDAGLCQLFVPDD